VELGSAFRNNDRVETMDGIADLLYVLYGACYTYDLNPDTMINSLYGSYDNFYNKIKLDVFNSLTTPEEHYQKLLNDISPLVSNAKNETIELYSGNAGSYDITQPIEMVLSYLRDVKQLLTEK
jgi:hypothetical protein